MKALLCCLLVASCGGKHVTLVAPQPTPDFKRRLVQFVERAPIVTLDRIETRCDITYGLDCESSHVGSSILLGDGREVVEPEDLLPVVASDSETAVHARATSSARRKQKYAGLAGLAITVVGASVWYVSRFDDTINHPGSETGRYVGYGLSLGGLIGGVAVSWWFHSRAESHTEQAFEAYPHDLAAELGICVKGLALYPCDSSAYDPATVGAGKPVD